jgi:hypothetical protein
VKELPRIVIIAESFFKTSIFSNLHKLSYNSGFMLERSQITSRSTWHAVGGVQTINDYPNVAKLPQHTIGLCKEIRKLTCQNIDLHITDGIMLAVTEERFGWLQPLLTKAKSTAQGYLPEYTPNADNFLYTEFLTKFLTATRQNFSLFDANASRRRS